MAARLGERAERYLIHVAGYNLGLIMRLLTGAGTPRGFRAGVSLPPPLTAACLSQYLLPVASMCRSRLHNHAEPIRLKTQFLNGLLKQLRYVARLWAYDQNVKAVSCAGRVKATPAPCRQEESFGCSPREPAVGLAADMG